MSSDRSSTATTSPKRLVTADNSTATPRPVSGLGPLASGGCSLVFLSCNPLPPVSVVLRKLSVFYIIRTRKSALREYRERLPRCPLAGLDGPFHVPAPLRGGLRPRPVDAAHGLLQRGTVIQEHSRCGHPRIAAARVDFCSPIGLCVA